MIIYQIRNLRDQKAYVGQTTVGMKHRQQQHISDLKLGKHRSIHLQRAWNKYGENCFIFEILSIASNRKELNNLEENIILQRKLTNPNYGYNIKNGGDNKEWTVQMKEKASKSKRSKGWSNLIGPDGREYNILSLHSFAKEHNLSYSVLYKVMNKKTRYHRGWHLKGTDLTLDRNDYKAQQRHPGKYPAIKSPLGIIYDDIINLKGFCRKNNLHAGHIRSVMYEGAKNHKGWIKA